MTIAWADKFLRALTSRDRYVWFALVVLSVVLRLPFLGAYDLVEYDGTYYINLARSLLSGAPVGGPFPIGYPLLIAPLLPFTGDGVRAAQFVSFTAAAGSLFLMYALAKRLVSRNYAVTAAFLLAATPLFVRLSLMTLSESAYIFWLLLGLLFYMQKKNLLFGATMGVAAITRPEALAVFVVLVGSRWREFKKIPVAVAGFLILYSVNIAVFSKSAGHIVWLQKTEFFGMSASKWQSHEFFVDFAGKEAFLEKEFEGESIATNLVVAYLKRFPTELGLLVRHAMPVLFLLALYGMVRKRNFLLATFVPFFSLPILTQRSEARYLLPFVPPLILYAMIGLQSIPRKRILSSAYVLLFAAAIAGFIVNWNALTGRVSAGFEKTKELGLKWRGQIDPWDKVADRKPFFAFYSGAKFIRLPAAPYDETIQYLVDAGATILSLHASTTHALRPALRPLLYDRPVIKGELRLRQLDVQPSGEMLYEVIGQQDPLETRAVTPVGGAVKMGPLWSPDGTMIAYRVVEPNGSGEIRIISPDGSGEKTLVTERATRDYLSWSPDSKSIAFANASRGRMAVFTYGLLTRELRQVTDGTSNDQSPSWSPDGTEIVYASDASGENEIWVRNLRTGASTQISRTGGNLSPALSPDGSRIAWIHDREGLIIYDRRSDMMFRAVAPSTATFRPAWSPDARFIAVTGEMWGGHQVFLVKSDGSGALLLTKASFRGRAMPSWGPDGERIVIVASEPDGLGVCVLTGIRPYLERLLEPDRIRAFRMAGEDRATTQER